MDEKSLGRSIADVATYVSEARYHDLFAGLRRDDPVAWAAPEGFRPFWVVSKHADIREVELNMDCFINAPRTFLISAEDEDRLYGAQQAGLTSMGRTVAQVDGLEHRQLRKITQLWFAPSNVNKLREQIHRIAVESIDAMAARGGTCDFVQDVALLYPLRVIMLILGLPREDERLLLKLTQEMFAPNDPSTDADAGVQGMLNASMAIGSYFEGVTKDRRANPRDDVATVIASAKIDGEYLSDIDVAAYYSTIITAGHDTTSSTSSGGLLALLQHPAELAKLQDGEVSIDQAVDEFLRWTSPIKHFFRTATADYDLRGRRIRKGDSLMLCYPSANRDEEVFDDPFAFRVGRTAAAHLAFGYGPHVCLGQHLAKLEIRTLYDELLKRLEHASLIGEPALTESNFVQGLKQLPIRYTMRNVAA